MNDGKEGVPQQLVRRTDSFPREHRARIQDREHHSRTDFHPPIHKRRQHFFLHAILYSGYETLLPVICWSLLCVSGARHLRTHSDTMARGLLQTTLERARNIGKAEIRHGPTHYTCSCIGCWSAGDGLCSALRQRWQIESGASLTRDAPYS